jgi:aldose sugar dehydrogenase
MKQILLYCCLAFLLSPLKAQTLKLDSTVLHITIAIDSTKLTAPWDIEWGFDNRIWMTDAKAIKAWNPTTKSMKTLYQFPRGYGMGLAVPKVLPISGPVYVYVVVDTSAYYAGGNLCRLYRFEYDKASDILVNPTILLAYRHPGEHSSGKVIIGLDGKIWLTTPEYTYTNDTIGANNGRVLRVNPDGSYPTGNYRPDYTYTVGHRNAQGMVQLPDGKIFSSEHSGPTKFDEVNLIKLGGNYGWPAMEGDTNCTTIVKDSCNSVYFKTHHQPPAYVGSLTPAGLDYYNHPAIPEWRNCLVIGTLYQPDSCLAVLQLNTAHDAVLGRRNYLGKAIGAGNFQDTSINNFKRTRDICVAPDGSIYCIVFDREFIYTADSVKNVRTRIVRIKNDAYVPVNNIITVLTQDADLRIYPNPASNKITIELNNNNFKMQHYRILDVQGRLVNEGTLSKNISQINTGNWPAGNYEFIVDGTNTRVNKLVIIR